MINNKIKIKIPIKELEKESVYPKVEKVLMNDPENAYTTIGIMIVAFRVKEEDIYNKSFSAWKEGLPTLYGRVDRSLRKMVKEGKAKVAKNGRAWVYWWVGESKSRN